MQGLPEEKKNFRVRRYLKHIYMYVPTAINILHEVDSQMSVSIFRYLHGLAIGAIYYRRIVY